MSKHEQILNLLPLELDDRIELKINDKWNSIESVIKNKGSIWVMMWDGNWYELEETDQNYDLIADTILKRLNEQLQS